jgi:hypothetical protein
MPSALTWNPKLSRERAKVFARLRDAGAVHREGLRGIVFRKVAVRMHGGLQNYDLTTASRRDAALQAGSSASRDGLRPASAPTVRAARRTKPLHDVASAACMPHDAPATPIPLCAGGKKGGGMMRSLLAGSGVSTPAAEGMTLKNMTYINHDGHQMTSDLMKQWPEHSKSQRERSEQLFSLRKLFLQALAQK